MGSSTKSIKENLLGIIPKEFCDPITELKPTNERELSTLLALWHNQCKIKWGEINLYSFDHNNMEISASQIFSPEIVLFNEYPMFAEDREHINTWGAMAGDIVGVTIQSNKLVYVENKIGSNFTGDGNDKENGQLAWQLKYLKNSKIKEKYFVLLSARAFFEKDWYSK
jgi:hypothetical protein